MPVSLLNLKTRSTVSRPAVSPNVTPKSPFAVRPASGAARPKSFSATENAIL